MSAAVTAEGAQTKYVTNEINFQPWLTQTEPNPGFITVDLMELNSELHFNQNVHFKTKIISSLSFIRLFKVLLNTKRNKQMNLLRLSLIFSYPIISSWINHPASVALSYLNHSLFLSLLSPSLKTTLVLLSPFGRRPRPRSWLMIGWLACFS